MDWDWDWTLDRRKGTIPTFCLGGFVGVCYFINLA
jgi:hypothetical protein